MHVASCNNAIGYKLATNAFAIQASGFLSPYRIPTANVVGTTTFKTQVPHDQ